MYEKRDCPITIELSLYRTPEGSQNCRFTINGDHHSFWISYANGIHMFGKLLDDIYGLCIEVDDPTIDRRIKYEANENHTITRISTETAWDGEGTMLVWTMIRELYGNEQNTVNIHINNNFGEAEYDYQVKLEDVCYAIAKAITDVLKQVGICGYHFHSIDDSIDMVRFLIVKEIALSGNKTSLFNVVEKEPLFSSLQKELALIEFEM